MAKVKIKTIVYRLIDTGKSPFKYVIQIKKWWGWSTLKETANHYSLDCINEADYWMHFKYPTSHLIKEKTIKK